MIRRGQFEINASFGARGQAELVFKFKMALGFMIRIRGYVLKHAYI